MNEREETIEEIERVLELTNENSITVTIPRSTAERAVSMLKEQKWNLLKEDADGIIHGLPEDDGPYFMTDGKDIWIDIYVDGVSDGIILDSGRDVREIKAWMYLPKLPKGEKNDR